MEQNIRLL
jgi:hypothetical protein